MGQRREDRRKEEGGNTKKRKKRREWPPGKRAPCIPGSYEWMQIEAQGRFPSPWGALWCLDKHRTPRSTRRIPSRNRRPNPGPPGGRRPMDAGLLQDGGRLQRGYQPVGQCPGHVLPKVEPAEVVSLSLQVPSLLGLVGEPAFHCFNIVAGAGENAGCGLVHRSLLSQGEGGTLWGGQSWAQGRVGKRARGRPLPPPAGHPGGRRAGGPTPGRRPPGLFP